jgi:antitoxin MazE
MADAQAQVVRWGNSLAVRIPKNVADAARLAEGDNLVLEVSAPGLVEIKAVQHPSLEQLLARITPDNVHHEVDWGKPVGNESW